MKLAPLSDLHNSVRFNFWFFHVIMFLLVLAMGCTNTYLSLAEVI